MDNVAGGIPIGATNDAQLQATSSLNPRKYEETCVAASDDSTTNGMSEGQPNPPATSVTQLLGRPGRVKVFCKRRYWSVKRRMDWGISSNPASPDFCPQDYRPPTIEPPNCILPSESSNARRRSNGYENCFRTIELNSYKGIRDVPCRLKALFDTGSYYNLIRPSVVKENFPASLVKQTSKKDALKLSSVFGESFTVLEYIDLQWSADDYIPFWNRHISPGYRWSRFFIPKSLASGEIIIGRGTMNDCAEASHSVNTVRGPDPDCATGDRRERAEQRKKKRQEEHAKKIRELELLKEEQLAPSSLSPQPSNTQGN